MTKCRPLLARTAARAGNRNRAEPVDEIDKEQEGDEGEHKTAGAELVDKAAYRGGNGTDGKKHE